MKEYCGKCGSKLDEKTGLCPLCDKDILNNLNKKKNKRKKQTIIIVLVIALLVAGIGGALIYFHVFDGSSKETKTTSNTGSVELTGDFSDITVTDEETALKAIGDAKDSLGIDDPEKELTNCQEEQVLEDTYYRFDQVYEDIPVYGRSVTLMSDEDGNCLSLTGNYLNLGDIDTKVEFDEDEIKDVIEETYGDDYTYYINDMVIYSLYDVDPQISWQVTVSGVDVFEDCFISAKTGDILGQNDMILTETTTISGVDVNGIAHDFRVEYENGLYTFYDINRNICLYDADDTTVIRDWIIKDSDGNTYSYVNGHFVDDDGNTISIEVNKDETLTIKNSDDEVIDEDAEYDILISNSNGEFNIMSSSTPSFDNPKGVTLLSNVNITYDFWYDNYSRKSFNDNNGLVKVVLDDNINGDTKNAYSFGNKDTPTTLLAFGSENSCSIETVSHEFAHSVEKDISNMNYQGESGAIKEALSDIYGEIVEAWSKNNDLNKAYDCDWIHGNRNMIDPAKNDYPSSYKDENWYDVSLSGDHGGVHTNNTVLSHAAYLMNSGIDGSYTPLTLKNMSDLFYKTMLHLTTTCTFEEFASYTLLEATNMKNKGMLSPDQYLTIEAAFNEVGILVPLKVNQTFKLNVYDINNDLYDSFDIDIDKTDSTSLNAENITFEDYDEISVEDQNPYELTLDTGIYKLTLTDAHNEDNIKEVYLNVDNDGESSIDVLTNFSAEKEIETDIPANAVEFNGHYYYLYNITNIYTYEKANEYCISKGGYLATITSAEENSFLFNYITSLNYQSAYFGLSDAESEGKWKWMNNEEVSYTNWASGEPNSEYNDEDYAMFYYKYPDGTWNDDDYDNNYGFICEWGDYVALPEEKRESTEREIVMVLDTSGSMSGEPIEETQDAANKFVDTVLKEDSSCGLVVYNDSAEKISDFSVNSDDLEENISLISASGSTNIEDGLDTAWEMLEDSNAEKKIIVLMSDGIPNSGKQGDSLVSFADEIKDDDIIIYTLGFFQEAENNAEAHKLMEDLATEGCHFEVADSDDLVFFFDDIADMINGQRYIYVRIACPVDVEVTYNGETLSSDANDRNTRTDFGTLTFEDNDTPYQTKILRLKEEAAYDLKISGYDTGTMNYSIGFMDDEGNYTDFREFNIDINDYTRVETTAEVSEKTTLSVDENGDGKIDVTYEATANSEGKVVEKSNLKLYLFIGAFIVIGTLIIAGIIIYFKKIRYR